MAELHIIGQIVSGEGFKESNLCCCWSLKYGGGWRLLEGATTGQTQTDKPAVGKCCNFAHPVDVHLTTKSIQGWPKVHFEVWHLDDFDRYSIVGYGFTHVPPVPGEHDVKCTIWRVVGSFREELVTRFLGGGQQLSDIDLVSNSLDRFKLTTEAVGFINIQLYIITRNFDAYGI
ncbi:unnamed protein product, partial [Soboliphyme baturini]|uniref:B9 domain-containing protein 2 n=1 Tax=Soboliphyme baturini TaxID=241478 RepID=A0A183IMY3_9BILA